MLKQQTTPLQALKHPLFNQQNISVFVKREELNHEQIQGNKLYKLELNLENHLNCDKKFLLTFGGAYSNHIAATAAACQQLDITAIGIIRGNELASQPEKWSHTLQRAQQQGMQFIFISRKDYRLKSQDNFIEVLLQDYQQQLADNLLAELQDAYQNSQITLLPEGGSNDLAVQGFTPLTQEIEQQCPQWTNLFCAVGTGATLAGLVASSAYQNGRTIHGVAVLAQGDYLKRQIQHWIETNKRHLQTNDWQLIGDMHQGGYAKISDELQNFIDTTWQEIQDDSEIKIEPVYSGKAFFAFWQKVQRQEFPSGSKIILLHSGGLQGLAANLSEK